MDRFLTTLLATLSRTSTTVNAWCVLPNHYQVMISTSDVLSVLREIGKFHGRSSYAWNSEENQRGRQIFYRATEREIRSEAHAFATLNYIHHNPVHHRYVKKWTDWHWSSAAQFLAETGEIEARRIWHTYPLLEYGTK